MLEPCVSLCPNMFAVDVIFAAFSHCQALHPDAESESEDGMVDDQDEIDDVVNEDGLNAHGQVQKF